MTARVRLAEGARRSAAHHQARRNLVEQRRERILDLLPVGAPIGTGDLARELGLSHAVVRSDLDALERRGRVERTGSEYGSGWLWTRL